MEMDLNGYIQSQVDYISEERVQHIIYHCLKGIEYMHKYTCLLFSNGVFHRDMKPENILIDDRKVKIADFGSCRNTFDKQVTSVV